MKNRCLNQSNHAFHYYGGRGISVCDEWLDFKAFFRDMGERPTKSHSLDRIDNDGNYEPANVRWATQAEQNLNRRNTLRAEVNGEMLPLKTLAEKYGVQYAAVRERYHRGLRGEDLVTRHKIGRKPKPK